MLSTKFLWLFAVANFLPISMVVAQEHDAECLWDEFWEKVLNATCDNEQGLMDKAANCLNAFPNKVWKPVRKCAPEGIRETIDKNGKLLIEMFCAEDDNEDANQLFQCLENNSNFYEKIEDAYLEDCKEDCETACAPVKDVFDKQEWTEELVAISELFEDEDEDNSDDDDDSEDDDE